MKTFREYYGDTVNPYYHSYAGSLLGPGLGQYIPVADLNAQRQLLGPKKENGHDKEITKSDLDQIEKYADRVFGALDIDVEFTRHFLDRVNDVRNQRQITSAELTRLFKQSYKKFGKTIRKLGPDAEAVISDMRTDINMPFVLNLKGGELELVAKTVMRKKNFKTTNPKLAFEDVSEGTYFTRTRSAKSRGQIMKKQLRPKIEPLMRDIGFKRGSYEMEPSSNASQLIITVDKSDLEKVKKALKPLGLPNIVQVVSEDTHGFKCPSGYKFDKKLMACVPIKSRFKPQYAYAYFFGGTKSGDQSGQAQNGQNGNGNGNGNGNAQGGNGNGNAQGGNGNGGNGGGNGG